MTDTIKVVRTLPDSTKRPHSGWTYRGWGRLDEVESSTLYLTKCHSGSIRTHSEHDRTVVSNNYCHFHY